MKPNLSPPPQNRNLWATFVPEDEIDASILDKYQFAELAPEIGPDWWALFRVPTPVD